VGVDRNPIAIEWARRDLAAATPSNLELVTSVAAERRLVDVVYLCDVLHHMDDDEADAFLRQQYARSRQALIVLDLHRHWLATLLFFIPGFLLCNWFVFCCV
jgi:2-polyprenyl-3-methyl-5-hydroxy-6-metoxy-1,4-benzoquinol methylase